MATSFIENVNVIANATVLAGGDIIDDAKQARDEAVAAALEAEASADQAETEQLLAADWARKAFNNPVQGSSGTGDDEYSSYHWSVISSQNAAPTLINDAVASLVSTWSSSKLTGIAATKSDIGHNHNGTYEPAFTKNTAFNKDFIASGGNSGTGIEVSRADHLHTGIYEPLINGGLPKLTAFNKNFGITAGTVSEGDHNHDTVYMATTTYADGSVIKPTSIPWVVNDTAPLATEVPKGTHGHLAQGIEYVPLPGDIISSTTVQGAIGQTNAILDGLNISERCNITGGSNAAATVAVSVPGTYYPVIISFNSGINSQNCVYNDGAQIYYNGLAGTNPGDEGVNLVEGHWSATITIQRTVDSIYSIAPMIKTLAGGTWELINVDFDIDIGSVGNTAGTNAVTIGGWITDLEEGTIIGIGITSSVVEIIDVESIVMSFSGAQDGALVASIGTIDHSDLTGTGAGGGVHTTSDIQDLDTELLAKADKIIPATANNFAILDANGNLDDSGISSLFISDKMDKVATPTLNNIILMDAGGNSLDSGVQLTDYALVGGETTQVFKVGASVADEDAIRKAEVTSLLTGYTTLITHDAHLAATNPHMVTYTDTGAAALVHTHTTTDITGLDDALLAKYSVVSGQITNNIPAFETGDLLKDSGISISDIDAKIVASDYATSVTGGTIKILVVGTDGYITTDGTTPGP